ncbi:MAG: hypothetical protein VXW49_19055, partial [Pseudomonadota bacterium]|nr:hypothetical protein [Pseudomonadota bacterium]
PPPAESEARVAAYDEAAFKAVAVPWRRPGAPPARGANRDVQELAGSLEDVFGEPAYVFVSRTPLLPPEACKAAIAEAEARAASAGGSGGSRLSAYRAHWWKSTAGSPGAPGSTLAAVAARRAKAARATTAPPRPVRAHAGGTSCGRACRQRRHDRPRRGPTRRSASAWRRSFSRSGAAERAAARRRRRLRGGGG